MATRLSHTTLTNPIPGWWLNNFSFPIHGTGSISLCYIQWSLCRTQLSPVAPLRNKCKKRHKCCPAVRSEAKRVRQQSCDSKVSAKGGQEMLQEFPAAQQRAMEEQAVPCSLWYHMEQISTCRHGGAHSETVDLV